MRFRYKSERYQSLRQSYIRTLACVASALEERAKNGAFLAFCPREKWGESKNKTKGWRSGRKETLPDKPLILKNPVRQRTELVIGWASRTLLTCVDQKFRVPERTFEACLQKALTFLTGRVFSRALRQYGRNRVVQCRRFGISNTDYYCRCSCDTIL